MGHLQNSCADDATHVKYIGINKYSSQPTSSGTWAYSSQPTSHLHLGGVKQWLKDLLSSFMCVPSLMLYPIH